MSATEPSYSFTIPSIEDDTILDCRLYSPEDLLHTKLQAAIVAHPYAPLGGSQDDAVVTAISNCLIDRGYIVVTFNFRGAGESHGKTSWTAKGEKDDFLSVIGFVLHYLEALASESGSGPRSTSLLLSGYSYGSLILSQLPPMPAISRIFSIAAIGTSAAEVILRARKLAAETMSTMQHEDRGRHPSDSGSRPPSASDRPHAKALTVTLGGEETNPSQRRPSRDAKEPRRPLDMVRKTAEVPHLIKAHMRRRSSSKSRDQPEVANATISQASPSVQYLLVSPLLPPLAHALIAPHSVSSFFGRNKALESGFNSLQHASLVVWGSDDGFSSHKRLAAWAERLSEQAPGILTWEQIEGAGHFWREQGVMKQLLQHISEWDSRTASRS